MKRKNVILCAQGRFREFPHLKFYRTEQNDFFFDATDYLECSGCTATHNVEEFKVEFRFWITASCAWKKVGQEELFVLNADGGNLLVDECLALLFIAYLDPWFAIHMVERITDMLTTGMVLSDTALLSMTRERFTKKDILTTFDDEPHEKIDV